jgi:hypothetical protein
MTSSRFDARLAHADIVSASVEALRDVLQRGQAIDLRTAEPDKSEIAHESLLQTILPLLDDAYAIIGRVAARFEESGEENPARVEVADIASLAGMALQERRSHLTHAQPCDHWTYLESCERSLRSLRKSASVVEAALARYGHLPRRVDPAADLESAIRVRSRYAALGRDLARAAAQNLDIQPRLRAVSRSIASLLNCEEYPSMRLGDRRELRMLQFRIQSWLSTAHPSESQGERTWEDAIAVVNLLSNVSRRSELVGHDAQVLADLAAIAAGHDDLRALRATASPLFGMDSELDALLDIRVPDGQQRERWQQVIARLVAERNLASMTDPDTEHSAHSAAS